MKITVDSKSLVEAIQWVTKDYDNKNDNAYVAFTVNEDGEGVLAHTNLSSHLRSPFTVLDVDQEEATALALDGRYLQRLAGALSSGPAELTVEDNGSLQIATSNGNYTAPTFDKKIGKNPEVITLGETSEAELFDSLQRLAKLCDPANAGLLPALGLVDIRLDEEQKTISMMATDRYSLGEIILDFDPSEDFASAVESGANLLLPYENATMVSPSKSPTVVELIFEKDAQKFGYSFANGRVALFTLKEAEPIKYASLKENTKESVENSFTVATKDLQKAIAVVSSLDPSSAHIYLRITEDSLVVTDATQSNSLAVDVEDFSVDKDYDIEFVRTVINSSFSPVATAMLKVNFKDASNAFVLEPVLENGVVADNVFVLTAPNV